MFNILLKGVYESENMMRNVEVDWNMVYLARTKGSTSASVTWLFDLSSSGIPFEHQMETLGY